jgi:HupE / UreJ protein
MAPACSFIRLVVIAASMLAWPIQATAHEVPDEVTVLTFLKPEGKTLTFLVRAPMRSLRDVDVPLKANGFLDLSRIDAPLEHAAQLWISDFVELYENDVRLARPRLTGARVSLPSDRSFASYDQALAHVRSGPLPADTEIYWEQGLLDVAYEYPIASDRSNFAIRPGLTRLGLQVNVTMRFLPPEGPERAFDVHADVGIVHLDPSWRQAFVLFAREGFFHILDGIDHLLFLFALVIPFRRFRPLVVVVTAFTIAHSITLITSASGLAPTALWFPTLVETLIAVSILYMALENIVGAGLERRWWVTFAFGLLHGFGFSFLLSERLQFAGSHLAASLLAFNVGVELGQLLVLAIVVPALGLLFRHVVAERIGTIILSALVAHTAWHWMTERGEQLSRYPWPTMDAVALSAALWWAMMAVGMAGLLWLLSGVVRRWEEGTSTGREGPLALPRRIGPGRD